MNTVENDIGHLVNTMVIAKMVNGRAISGILCQNTKGEFSIKLGVKSIPLLPGNIKKVTKLVS